MHNFPLKWSESLKLEVERAYSKGRLLDIKGALRHIEEYQLDPARNSLVIGILRTFTIENLVDHLRLSFSIIPSSPNFVLGELENIEQELLDVNSHFLRANPDFILVLWRLEELYPILNSEADLMSPEQRLDALDKLLNRIQQLVAEYQGDAPLIFSNFSIPDQWIGVIHDHHRQFGIAEIVNRLNQLLYELASQKKIKIFDFSQWLMSEGSEAIDQKMDLYARQPISTGKALSFTDAIARVFKPMIFAQSKVLAVDLDNTLWGGVLGEDGVLNLKIGQDYPGNIYWRIQQAIYSLKSRGVLLVLLSKNNLVDVEDAFKVIGKIPLKLSDFSVVKINWNEKYLNLIEASKELNLGIDSFVFLDDQPFEQEQMRQSLPEVKVLNNRNDPLDILNAISNSHFFDQFSIGDEDQIRTQDYKSEINRNKMKKGLRKEVFLSSLKLKADVQQVGSKTIQRTVQMLAKTNQFNLTTRRHNEAFIRKMLENDRNLILIISLRDKFGDQGIIGLCVALQGLTRGEMILDSFLLSCRALGRGAEDLLWSELLRYLEERDCNLLRASYIPSKKNIQVSKFYDRLGMEVESFTEKETKYIMKPPFTATKPAWIELKN